MMDMAIAMPDYGQVGSNPSTPDSHHYFPLADDPTGTGATDDSSRADDHDRSFYRA
jgi:hypothetical protein